MKELYDEAKDFFTISGIAVLVVFVFIYLLIAGINLVALPGHLAEIEQLRIDASRANSASNEDILGQVAEANKAIRSNQAYNRMWFFDLAVPDEWDNVETITVVVQ